MLAFTTQSLLEHLRYVFLGKSVNTDIKDVYSHLLIEQLKRHETKLTMRYRNVQISSILQQDENADDLGGDPGQVYLVLAAQLREQLSAIKKNAYCRLKEYSDGLQVWVKTPSGSEHHLFCSTYYGNRHDFSVHSVPMQPFATINGATLKAMCNALRSVGEFKEDSLTDDAQPVIVLRFTPSECVGIATGQTKRTLAVVFKSEINYIQPLSCTYTLFIFGTLLPKIAELCKGTITIHLDDFTQPNWICFSSATRELICRIPAQRSRNPAIIEFDAGRYDAIPTNGTRLWSRSINLDNIVSAAQMQTKVGDEAKNLIVTEDDRHIVLLQQDQLNGKNESRFPIEANQNNAGDFYSFQIPGSVLATTLPAVEKTVKNSEINPNNQIEMSLWRFPRPKPSNVNPYIHFLRFRFYDSSKVLLTIAILPNVLEGANTSD